MTKDDKKSLKADLKALLTTYNVVIAFTCSDSSDTHGLRDDRIVIKEAATDKIVFDTHNDWHLSAHDLR